MYLVGHLGAATAAYVLVRRGPLRRRAPGPSPALAGLLALATLPDADRYVPGLAHRGLTHTVWFAVLVGVAAALAAAAVERLLAGAGARSRPNASPGPRFGPRSQRVRRAVRGFAVGGGSVLVHLAADAATPMGVRPLAPLSDASWSLSLVRAADARANAALFVAGAALVCADRWGAAAGRSAPVRRLRRALRVRLPSVRGRA